MPQKTLVFGPRGYLGSRFLASGGIAADVDIADRDAVARALDAAKPDVVVNAAGRTGRPNVDWCEDHKAETLRSNVLGPMILLEECMKRSVYFVHLGSGCVYQGRSGGRGFAEDDPPNFIGSYYARTKGWIDQILKEFPVLVLRLRMPFEDSLNERSLIAKVLKYPRVIDVDNSLTYLPDFISAAAKLIAARETGVFNMVNPGAISPYKIVQLYREIVDPSHVCQKLAVGDLSEVTKAGRSNCLLSTQKLASRGIFLRPVEEAVRTALAAIAAARKTAPARTAAVR